MQLTVQLESSDGQFQAQVCSHQQKTKIINDDDDFRNVRLIQVSKKKINQFSISIDN